MYSSDESRSLLELARRGVAPELSTSDLPEGDALRAIVFTALASNRDERYVSAAAMLRDLEGYASRARLTTSALELGDWLATTFGVEVVARRRARERAIMALERGAPLVAEPIAPQPEAQTAHTAAAVSAPAPAPHVPGDGPKATRRARAIAVLAVAVVMLAGVLFAVAFR